MLFLIKGLILGLSAGVSPGPLLALVMSETLRHNRVAGVRVAIAPLITDAPIILLCFFLLRFVASTPQILAIVSILGGLYVFWLGLESIRLKEYTIEEPAKRQSLRKGIITNVLSPHPYLFWMTVGSATMLQALEIGAMPMLLFLAGFYVCLIGSKVAIAILLGSSKSIISPQILLRMNQILGAVLILFSVLLLIEGIKNLLR